MIDREKYIDDYGLQVDPLFDRIDKLETALQDIIDIPPFTHEDAIAMVDVAKEALALTPTNAETRRKDL